MCNIALFTQALKDKLRTYKQRISTVEHTATQQNNQILIMEKAIAALKEQLAVSLLLEINEFRLKIHIVPSNHSCQTGHAFDNQTL